ncbi:MAG TPA: hypothetical protein VEB86_17605 [Chryseosolibacter sp.]|nr:hypothetical protein [Chryseosolibacter sp.]
MSYQTNSDNIYQEGTLISAKENPSLALKIIAYKQRIYYCSVVGDEARKQLVYFERELISPSNQSDQNYSVDDKTNKS